MPLGALLGRSTLPCSSSTSPPIDNSPTNFPGWKMRCNLLMHLGPSIAQLGENGRNINAQPRTLTPRIKVRILVPQPLEYLRIHNCLAHRPILPLASS